MLNKNSDIPLYIQIQKLIRSRIDSGIYPVNQKIHSENELCAQCEVGRPTVRQAIGGLVEKGLLESYRGKGVFVKEQEPSLDLFSYMGTTEAFSRLGKDLETKVVKQSVCEDSTLHFIETPKGNQWIELIRMRYVEGDPTIWERTLLNREIVPGLDKINLNNESLLNLLKHSYKIDLGEIQQYFGVRKLNEEQQALFSLTKEKSLLYMEREIQCNGQKGNYFVQIFIDTEKYRLYQKINTNF